MNSDHHSQPATAPIASYYNPQLSFNRCESNICILTHEEARQRLERPSSSEPSTSSSSFNASVKDFMNEKDLEKNIIALDYRLKLKECLRS